MQIIDPSIDTESPMRRFFRSKIHRATVTHADLHYEGSITIDRDLLDAADISPFEEVHVWNITRGTRLYTYTIEGPRGSGTICANGAAAHLVNVGDLVIIATFQLAAGPEDAPPPRVIRVDEKNMIIGTHPEIAGPLPV
jgi:aspartate 1-decarboxylase